MHFVICMFVTFVCLASLLIFKEVFNKVFAFLLGVGGSATFAYAMAILIKKLGEWFSVWSGDPKYINSNFLWIFPIVLAGYLAVHFYLIKREKKNNE